MNARQFPIGTSVIELGGSGQNIVTIVQGGPIRVLASAAPPAIADVKAGTLVSTTTTFDVPDGSALYGMLDDTAGYVQTVVRVGGGTIDIATTEDDKTPGGAIPWIQIKISYTTIPTGGTWAFTIKPLGAPLPSIAVTGLAWNASADAIHQAIVTASSGHFTNSNLAVTNGPATTFVTIMAIGDRLGQAYELTSLDVSGITGGSGVAASGTSGTSLPPRGDTTVGVLDGLTIYNATGNPTTGTVTVSSGGPTGSIAQMATTGAGNSSAWIQNLAETLDSERRPFEYTVHNPHPTPTTIGIEQYNTTGNNNIRPVILPPGWSKVIMTESQRTGSISDMGDRTSVNRARIRIGQYTSEQQFYAADSIVRLNVARIARARLRKAEVGIIFDDAWDDFYTTTFPIIQEFPQLKGKVGLAVISSRVGTANYCTLAQIKEMVDSGWIYAINHSDTHGGASSRSFETSQNPARVGQATGTEFCVEWKAGANPSSGTFTLTFGALGATAAIAYNATLRAVTEAIIAVLPGCIVTCEDPVNSNFGLGNGFRVVMPTARALPTISNTTNYDIGWAYTIDDILQDFNRCRDFLRTNGLARNGSENIAVYPVGSYGRNVHTAMLAGGYDLGFIAGPINGSDYTDLSSIAQLNPFRVPRRDIVSENIAGVANAGRRVGSSLVSTIQFGGVLYYMGHRTNATGGDTGVIIAPNTLRARLATIVGLAEKHLRVVTAMQTRDRAEKLFGPLTQRAHGAL